MTIANASGNELGKITGGKAGDQTGGEIRVIGWYLPSSAWDWYFDHPSDAVMEWNAVCAEEMARNDKIGYDQGNDRNTYWAQLKKVGYRPSKITTACECDCSSGVAANVKAAGHLANDVKCKAMDTTAWTGNLRSKLIAAGWKGSNASKYLTSDKYARRGAILLNEDGHVTTFVTNGSKAERIGAAAATTTGKGGSTVNITLNVLRKGSEGAQVKTLQRLLNSTGYECGTVDGIFGTKTYTALRTFQTGAKIDVDGVCGKDTWGKLLGV